MAYDERLAQRVRYLLESAKGISEREQFGGIAFMTRGNVACGIIGDELLVRVGPARHDEAMKSRDAKPSRWRWRDTGMGLARNPR
jgi:TfoX/Sxy family transcriptional regulator of competence genes